MNTAAYILILAILILGGAIATAGDRIGTKVGKARLSLFNLRPRKTATLITILTGVLISASTLTILFTTSESLRKGLFEYDQTQKKLRSARTELEGARRELGETRAQKSQVEGQLSQAKSEQSAAQKRLDETNQSLQTVLAELTKRLAQQARTETNLSETQSKLERIEADFREKRSELEKLQAERQALIERIAEGKAQIERRDREIAKRDREIAARDRAISEQEQLLAEREQQLAERNQLLAEREQQLAERNQLLAEREQQLTEQEKLIAEREKQLVERDELLAERGKQLAERDELLAERNQLLAERQKQLDERDELLAERDELLAERETRLQELATQKAFIEREVQFLERDLQVLKEGTIVLRRNQVLASGVVRILQPPAARQAVDRLLEEANRNAIKLAQPGLDTTNQRAIEITRAEVEEVIARIDDGQDYVVRILSAANYLLGEQQIQVFIDAAQNQVVFLPGDVVAATSVDPATMNGDQIRERIELLLAASSFRGRRVGIIADTIQIADGRIETLIRFLEQLQQQTQPVDVRAIAAEVTYTAGPLKMNLVAVKDGKILFQT